MCRQVRYLIGREAYSKKLKESVCMICIQDNSAIWDGGDGDGGGEAQLSFGKMALLRKSHVVTQEGCRRDAGATKHAGGTPALREMPPVYFSIRLSQSKSREVTIDSIRRIRRSRLS